jgi:UDPglucose 6-dehydrogenase
MTICVFGLWHLGCVTAACVAEKFRTIGLDPDPIVIRDLQSGKPPILEGGLDQLIQSGIASNNLRFTDNAQAALQEAEIVWITFDTPVNEEDVADHNYVETQISSLFPYLRPGSTVLISSQLPVGSTFRIESAYRRDYPNSDVAFAYSPENLRLGKAIHVFQNPGRIVIGVRNLKHRQKLSELLSPFCQNLLWMSVESAEMTKHALNAFLANSIAFINEVAALCEEVGADAGQVSQGLKSDERIGPRAYLTAGGPYSGGTLARDISSLTQRAKDLGVATPLLEAIRMSNDLQKDWSRNKLKSLLGPLSGKTISVLGLTYRPGTDTLRRSASLELCTWLSSQGAYVRAFDPAVKSLPEELSPNITLCGSAVETFVDADAVVLATEWKDFRNLKTQDFLANMKSPILLDAQRFLMESLGASPALRYVAVGMSQGDA